MDTGKGDVLRIGGGKKRKSNNRRSSILKTRSPSRALSEIDPNAPPDDDLTVNTKKNRHSRRVSFSATCQIKEFLKDGHWQAANQAQAAQKAAEANNQAINQITGLDLLLKGPIQDPVGPQAGQTAQKDGQDQSTNVATGTAQDASNVQPTGASLDKTQLFGEDTGDMEMTTCIPNNIDLDTTLTHPIANKRRSVRGSTDEPEVSTNNAELTTCDDDDVFDVVVTNPKVDAMSALSRIMSAPKSQPPAPSATISQPDRTVLGGDEMDFTACHNISIDIDSTAPQPPMESSAALLRIMSGKTSTLGPDGFSDKTTLFIGGTGDMDMTECVTQKITMDQQVSKSVANDKTQIFDNNDDMDLTACVTTAVGKAEPKVNTMSALSRIMSGKSQSNTENAVTWNKSLPNKTIVGDADMDFTRCNTAPIDLGSTLPVDNKLDTASVLANFMSRQKSLPSQTSGEQTCLFDKGEDMEMTTCLGKTQLQEPITRTLDDVAGKQSKIQDRTVFDAADMDFTRCHTGIIESQSGNKLESTSVLSRIMSTKKTGVKDELVQKVSTVSFLQQLSAPKVNIEENASDKTKLFTTDGTDGDMDFTACITTNLTRNQTLGMQSALGGKSMMEKTCVFEEGQDMEITTCLSKTQLEAFQEGKRNITGVNPGDISRHALVQRKAADRTTISDVDMDFTTCTTAAIEVPASLSLGTDDRVESASALSRIMSSKSASAGPLPDKEIQNSDKTKIFTEEDSAIMEFTECLTTNLTGAKQADSHSAGTHQQAVNKTCVFDKGEDMEMTTCLSKTQLPEPECNLPPEVSVVGGIANRTTLQECQMDLTKCQDLVGKPTNSTDYLAPMKSGGASKNTVQAKNMNFTTVDAEDMDFTVCNTVKIVNATDLLKNTTPDIPDAHSTLQPSAPNSKFEETRVFHSGEDMEMTTCLTGPALSVADVAAMTEPKRCDRTRLYSQGSEDMEFTGQIADVIVSGHALELQQKENPSLPQAKATVKRLSMGLSVRSAPAPSLTQEVPTMKPPRSGLADITHNFSVNEPGANMELTMCPDKTIHQRLPSASDSESDQDILRPDDGVPIRLGTITAPRLTEDGLIYTQATFDKSLKFIGDIEQSVHYENQSRLETLVEASRETSSVYQSVSMSASVRDTTALDRTSPQSENKITHATQPATYRKSSSDNIEALHNSVTYTKSEMKSSLSLSSSQYTDSNRTSPLKCESAQVDYESPSKIAAVSEDYSPSKVSIEQPLSIDIPEDKTKVFGNDEGGDMEMTVCSGDILTSQDLLMKDVTREDSAISAASEIPVQSANISSTQGLSDEETNVPTHEPQLDENESKDKPTTLEGQDNLPSINQNNSTAYSSTIAPGELLDMDDLPNTEDLMPLSHKLSLSRKRHPSTDLPEESRRSQNVSLPSKIARLEDPTPQINIHDAQESVSLLDVSKSFLKPVPSKPLGTTMTRSYGDISAYNVPLMGTSSSQMSLVDISQLDDSPPQTINDYLQLFNIRNVEARRNSTDVRRLNMEEPTDTVGLLKQALLDEPRLDLLKTASAKLEERKSGVSETLELLEREMLDKLSLIFKDIILAPAEDRTAMKQKYNKIYKACSIKTKATLKNIKCDFLKSLNLKYQEQVRTASHRRGELLDKIEFVSVIHQSADEACTSMKLEVTQQSEPREPVPREHGQQLLSLNERLEALQELCRAREQDIDALERQIQEASEKLQTDDQDLKDRLCLLVPTNCQTRQRDERLNMARRLSSWRTAKSSPSEYAVSFIFDSLILRANFSSNNDTSANQYITELALVSKLAEESTDYAKLCHNFVMSTFNEEALRETYPTESHLTSMIHDVAVQVAVATDLGMNIMDIGVRHKVRVEDFGVSVTFVNLAAFAKFVLVIVIDPSTYPTTEPLWDLIPAIGSISKEDIEPHIRSVEPGLGYLFRIVSAVDEYLHSKGQQ